MFTFKTSAEWVKLDNGLANNYIRDLAISGSDLFAATLKGVCFSSDNGNTWVNKGLGESYINAITISGRNIYAAGQGGIYLSRDNGDSWTNKGFGGHGLGVNDTLIIKTASHDKVVIVGTNNNDLFISTNNGDSWQKSYNGLPKSILSELAISENNIYVGFRGAGVYHSSDNGLNWTAKNSDTNNLNICSLTANGNEVLTGTVNKGIFLSTDKGNTWVDKNSGLEYKYITDVIKIGKNYLRLADLGFYLSKDEAENWTRDYSFSGDYSNSLFVKENYIFILGQNGLYRSKLVDLGVTDIDGIKLSKTIKFIVTPNPAKEYILVTPFVDLDNAVISITDFSGKVYTSCNFPYIAKSHSVGIDTREFSWGMYFCIVRSGSCSGSFQFMINK